MAEDEIRKWIRQKLNEGVEEQNIRKVISKKGYDSSLVSEVKYSTPGSGSQENTVNDLDLSHRKNHLSNVSEGVEGKLNRGWSTGLVIIILVAALGTGLMYAPSLDISSIELPEVNTEEEPEIEGEETRVVLTERLAQPSRPQISEDDGVRFVNNASHAFNVTFDREVESFIVESGETELVDVRSVVYYTATPVDAEAEEVKGSVSVQ